LVNVERPIRKDELLVESRGVFIESWLPERRSRHRPLIFVHGELAGSWIWERYLCYFAQRGWEGHALNLRGHHLSEPAEVGLLDFDHYLDDVLAAMGRLLSAPVVMGHGIGGLLALRAAERRRPSALVLLSPALPAQLRRPPRPHVLREIPDTFGRELVGWQQLPEQLHRNLPDLSVEDVLRVQHLMGRESGSVRRAVLSGIAVERNALLGIPSLVIGAGLDRWYPEPESEELAEWLDAAYEPFGAHSHYGLVIGSESHTQVADTIRAFLESHRL
jgi:pimeloyl-ACP methyl ester carboxylesterase